MLHRWRRAPQLFFSFLEIQPVCVGGRACSTQLGTRWQLTIWLQFNTVQLNCSSMLGIHLDQQVDWHASAAIKMF